MWAWKSRIAGSVMLAPSPHSLARGSRIQGFPWFFEANSAAPLRFALELTASKSITQIKIKDRKMDGLNRQLGQVLAAALLLALASPAIASIETPEAKAEASNVAAMAGLHMEEVFGAKRPKPG